jgi:hypothetical protein
MVLWMDHGPDPARTRAGTGCSPRAPVLRRAVRPAQAVGGADRLVRGGAAPDHPGPAGAVVHPQNHAAAARRRARVRGAEGPEDLRRYADVPVAAVQVTERSSASTNCVVIMGVPETGVGG